MLEKSKWPLDLAPTPVPFFCYRVSKFSSRHGLRSLLLFVFFSSHSRVECRILFSLAIGSSCSRLQPLFPFFCARVCYSVHFRCICVVSFSLSLARAYFALFGCSPWVSKENAPGFANASCQILLLFLFRSGTTKEKCSDNRTEQNASLQDRKQ